MNYNDISCCFTGHRRLSPDKLDEIKQRLKDEVDRAYEGGYRRFLCGGAIGFDTLCAYTVIEKRRTCPDVALILVIPCMAQEEQWCEEDRRVYREIYSECDECYCMSELYTEGCMHTRNRAMVDESSLCIAYLENFKSGTAYTYKYAKKNGLVTVNIANVDETEAEEESDDEYDED